MKEVMIQKCKKHGDTEHVFYSGRWCCKKCMVEYDRNKRHRIKEKLVEYKGGKCEICGYDRCLNALDFHHKNKQEKSFALNSANFNRSFEELKREADKCILVCSNCHREIHYKENEERISNSIVHEIEFYNKNTKIDNLDIDKIKGEIDSGLYQSEIAIKNNVSLSTLKRFLKANNIIKKRVNINIDKLLVFYAEKSTYTYLAKKFNTTVSVIKRWCFNNNVIPKLNEIRNQKGLKELKEDLHLYK